MSTEHETQDHLLVEEALVLKDVLREHGTRIGTAVIIILAVIIGVGIFRGRREASQEDALITLSSSQTAQDLIDLIERYPSSAAAPLAVLRLAQTHFDAGDYASARAQYEQFQAKFGTHALAPAAALGLIHCTEEQGDTTQALEAFDAFAKSHADHFLGPQAIFGRARCLDKLGRLSEAKAVYESFIVDYPDSRWLERAEDALKRVSRRLDLPTTAAPVPVLGDVAVPPAAAALPADTPLAVTSQKVEAVAPPAAEAAAEAVEAPEAAEAPAEPAVPEAPAPAMTNAVGTASPAVEAAEPVAAPEPAPAPAPAPEAEPPKTESAPAATNAATVASESVDEAEAAPVSEPAPAP